MYDFSFITMIHFFFIEFIIFILYLMYIYPKRISLVKLHEHALDILTSNIWYFTQNSPSCYYWPVWLHTSIALFLFYNTRANISLYDLVLLHVKESLSSP